MDKARVRLHAACVCVLVCVYTCMYVHEAPVDNLVFVSHIIALPLVGLTICISLIPLIQSHIYIYTCTNRWPCYSVLLFARTFPHSNTIGSPRSKESQMRYCILWIVYILDLVRALCPSVVDDAYCFAVASSKSWLLCREREGHLLESEHIVGRGFRVVARSFALKIGTKLYTNCYEYLSADKTFTMFTNSLQITSWLPQNNQLI